MTDAATFPTSPPSKASKPSGAPPGRAQGTYRFDRAAAARRPATTRLLHRHSPADRIRLAAHRPRLQLHPHGPRRPLPAHARQAASSTRWAGTTTACPPSAACRTTTACAATRRSPTTPDFAPPFEGGDGKSTQGRRPAADLAPQLHRALRDASPPRTRSSSRTLWRTLGLSRRLDADLPHHRRRGAAAPRSARSCATSSAARPTRPMAPDPVGRHLPHRGRPGRARRQGAAGRLPPRRLPPARRRHRSRSRPPAPSCSPPASRSSRIRTTSATRPLFGTTVTTPLFGVEVPGARPPPRPEGQGHRHRHDLHLRRRHRRGLVARARPAQPRDHRLRRPHHRRGARRRSRTEAGRAAYAELAGKTVFSAKQAIVELLRESGDLIGDPKPITHPVKFFEKGDKPLEIVSTRQWYIAQRRPRRGAARAACSTRGTRDRLRTPTSCACATRTGSAASPATG